MSLLTTSANPGLLGSLADLLDPPQNRFLHDPAAWVDHRLGEFFWSKQVEIANSLVVHRRTAVKSCHGVGKSFSAARFIAWWLDVHPPGEAFVVSTAPTAKQVEAVLWREVNKASKKADPPFFGRVLTTEWKIGNELVAYGRKPADHDPTAFQGIHARYVLVIIDEACGIPKELWIAANSLASNEDCRILAIGNPDDPTAHFAEVCKPDSGWHVIQISAFDSPNFTDEEVPQDLKVMLVSKTYVAEMAHDCGEDSGVYAAKVLGDFPEDSEDGVVRISAVKACQTEGQENTEEPNELGVDVGAGGDFSVIYHRLGRKAIPLWRGKTPDTMKLVGTIVEYFELTGATCVKVDKTGVGQGVTDRLRELGEDGKHEARVIGVMVGSASSKPERFPRLRDQIWWEVGRLLSEDGGWDLSEVDDRTVAQLTAPHYSLDSSGRIKVEKKDETKARIGRSPDDADALLLAFYSAPQPRVVFAPDEEGIALDGQPLRPLIGPYAIANDQQRPFV